MSDWSPARIAPQVARLESDDAFERLNAIEELERLTKMTLGFRFNDPPPVRAAAVGRWKDLIDSRKREDEKTEKLKAAIEMTGATVDVGALKHAMQSIPTDKIQGYLNALILKMKAQQARCEACHVRQATVRVTELGGGKVLTRHLCDTCARERGDVLV